MGGYKGSKRLVKFRVESVREDKQKSSWTLQEI
jgi:hypothetical protein